MISVEPHIGFAQFAIGLRIRDLVLGVQSMVTTSLPLLENSAR